jgi:hypothetical protein
VNEQIASAADRFDVVRLASVVRRFDPHTQTA